jgi:hypothetical protein
MTTTDPETRVPDPIDLLKQGDEDAVHELIRAKQGESLPV